MWVASIVGSCRPTAGNQSRFYGEDVLEQVRQEEDRDADAEQRAADARRGPGAGHACGRRGSPAGRRAPTAMISAATASSTVRREALQELVGDRLAGGGRVAEVAAEHPLHERPYCDQDRLVEAEARSDRAPGSRGWPRSPRSARPGRPGRLRSQTKSSDGQPEQRGYQLQQAPDDEPEHGSLDGWRRSRAGARGAAPAAFCCQVRT